MQAKPDTPGTLSAFQKMQPMGVKILQRLVYSRNRLLRQYIDWTVVGYEL